MATRDYEKQPPNLAVLEDEQRGKQVANILMPQDGQLVVIADTGSANTEFAVPHTLKDANGVARKAVGYIVVKKDKASDVYTSTGGTAWTTTNAYLKAVVANTAITVLVF